MRPPVEPFRRPRAGFTLIELLVVVALIAGLAALLGTALRGGLGGSGLPGAERALAGSLQSARTLAVLRGAETLVLVRDDPADRDRDLRLVVVAVRDGAGGTWNPVDQGTFLPRGLHVVPAGRGATVASSPAAAGGWRPWSAPATFPNANAPLVEGGAGWLGIRFRADGTAPDHAGAKVVIAETRRADATAPLEFPDEAPRGGFLVLRQGGTVIARDPEDLR